MEKYKSLFGYLLFGAVMSALPSVSWAGLNLGGTVNVGNLLGGSAGGGDGGIASSLCTIVQWFTEPGGIGSALGSLSVIFLGIGAFFGKVTWGTAVTFTAGIMAIFGAPGIVSSLTGVDAYSCGGSSISISI